MGGDDDKPRAERSEDDGKAEGRRMPLGNLRATVKMAPIVRLKPPSWDEVPTAPQTRRGGSNIHDEGPDDDSLEEALDEALDEPEGPTLRQEGVTMRRGRPSDATTTRRPSHPPDDTTQRRSSRPPPHAPPVSVPRWDDESLPFADARELAKQIDPDGTSASEDDDPLEDDWDDVTMPRPRPSPQDRSGPPAPPRRVSTSAPQSADFPSADPPAVVVSPVLVLDAKEPTPAPEWIEPPATARAPEVPTSRGRGGIVWVLALVLIGILGAFLFAFVL